MCGHRAAPPQTRAQTDARPDERVTDPDRAAAAELLADAAGAGLLTLQEADERLARTWQARTAGELAALRADLPARWLAEHRSTEDRRREVQDARGHVRAYLLGMSLMVGIWLVVGVTAGAWYPWPVWPALGWGLGVLGHVRTAVRPAVT